MSAMPVQEAQAQYARALSQVSLPSQAVAATDHAVALGPSDPLRWKHFEPQLRGLRALLEAGGVRVTD